MKVYKLLFIILVAPHLSQAQEKLVGTITTNNNTPLPFAFIGYYNHPVAATANAEGKFVIKKIVGDSFKVFSNGYKPQNFIINKQTDSLLIRLENSYKVLQEVIIKPRAKTVSKIVLGHYKKINTFWSLSAITLQEATFIPNPNHIRGYIDEIKFKLADFRNKPFMLRIRLFNLDTKTGLPFEDLLFTDNILSADNLRRINKFSIKSKNIEMPENGVFVSFEWLPINNEATKVKLPWVLGHYNADNHYVYSNLRESGWVLRNSPYASGKFHDGEGYEVPSIAITVSY